MTHERSNPLLRGTFGLRLHDISTRLDAAYTERNNHAPGTTGYRDADAGIELVYADLRLLNVEIRRTPGTKTD